MHWFDELTQNNQECEEGRYWVFWKSSRLRRVFLFKFDLGAGRVVVEYRARAFDITLVSVIIFYTYVSALSEFWGGLRHGRFPTCHLEWGCRMRRSSKDSMLPKRVSTFPVSDCAISRRALLRAMVIGMMGSCGWLHGARFDFASGFWSMHNAASRTSTWLKHCH